MSHHLSFAAALMLALLLQVSSTAAPPVTVITKNPGVKFYGKEDSKGPPTGTLTSAVYCVPALPGGQDSGRVRILEKGKFVWIDETDVVSRERALDYFSGRIEGNSQDATAFGRRALTFELQPKPDYGAAIVDYGNALAVAPVEARPAWYSNRGRAFYLIQQYPQAIVDFGEALKENPRLVPAYINRGLCKEAQGKYSDAAYDYIAAIAKAPKDPAGYNALALMFATKQEAPAISNAFYFLFRIDAVDLAEIAYGLPGGDSASHLDTLAQAYARRGQFGKAAYFEMQALLKDPCPPRSTGDEFLGRWRGYSILAGFPINPILF
jgi:tetratricopeptide (TPR) repeat protein